MEKIIASASVVGFSGARSPAPGAAAAVALAAAAVAPGAVVCVGCQRGVDEFARSAFPGARVFRASSFGAGRGSFAARSVACVRAVAVPGGLWVSFPASACPAGLAPSPSSSRCFCGAGSGSWASLAFAVGLGVSSLVWLPAGVSPPVGWGFSPVGGGWFSFVPAVAPVQLSFF